MPIPPSPRAALLAPLLLAACASVPRRDEPPAPSAWQLDRLYFGRAIGDTGRVSDSAFAVFLRDVVTPRLPDGFTVLHGEGQWRSGAGTVVREPAVLLEFVHHPDAASERALGELIADYKRRFAQESVMRLTLPARVRF